MTTSLKFLSLVHRHNAPPVLLLTLPSGATREAPLDERDLIRLMRNALEELELMRREREGS